MTNTSTFLTAADQGHYMTAPMKAAEVQFAQSLNAETTVTGLAWSSDGQRLAAYSDFGRQIIVWGAGGSEIMRMRGERSYFCNSIAFLPGDGELISPAIDAGDEQSAFTVWSVDSGKPLGNVPGPFPDKPSRYNRAVAFELSHDGESLAAITSAIPDEPVTVYSLAASWQQARFNLSGAQSITISPDGRMLAVGTLHGTVSLFELASERPVGTLEVYTAPPLIGVGAMAFSPDGRFLATGATAATGGTADGNGREEAPIKVWRLEDGALVAAYTGDYAPVRQLSWNANGQFLAAAASDRSFRLVWPAVPDWPGVRIEFPGPVMSVGFSPDGHALAVAAGADVTLFALLQ